MSRWPCVIELASSSSSFTSFCFIRLPLTGSDYPQSLNPVREASCLAWKCQLAIYSSSSSLSLSNTPWSEPFCVWVEVLACYMFYEGLHRDRFGDFWGTCRRNVCGCQRSLWTMPRTAAAGQDFDSVLKWSSTQSLTSGYQKYDLYEPENLPVKSLQSALSWRATTASVIWFQVLVVSLFATEMHLNYLFKCKYSKVSNSVTFNLTQFNTLQPIGRG